MRAYVWSDVMKWQKASKKCRKTSSAVESCVERSTGHPRSLVLRLRNLRSLKCLGRRKDKRNFGLPPALLECETRFLRVTIAAGIVDTHSSTEESLDAPS